MGNDARLNLHLFGEGGAGASDGGGDAAAVGDLSGTAQNSGEILYGKQPAEENSAAGGKETQTQVTASTDEQRRAEFEKLISGEYKDLYTERTQKMIDSRFKKEKLLEKQLSDVAPILDLLSSKYGVDAKDIGALSKAISDDDAFYEEEAMQKGLTVEQLKYVKRIERENAEIKRTAEELRRKEASDRIYAQWQREAEGCKAIYPSFDFRAECANESTGKRFLGLLKSGVDVRTAYEVIHRDEVIGGAMQYTAKQVANKITNDIRARGMRPEENGAGGSGAAKVVKTDPHKFTRKDREEISRRVLRGERIEL